MSILITSRKSNVPSFSTVYVAYSALYMPSNFQQFSSIIKLLLHIFILCFILFIFLYFFIFYIYTHMYMIYYMYEK